jgi:hypothetical protein
MGNYSTNVEEIGVFLLQEKHIKTGALFSGQ